MVRFMQAALLGKHMSVPFDMETYAPDTVGAADRQLPQWRSLFRL